MEAREVVSQCRSSTLTLSSEELSQKLPYDVLTNH